MDCRRLLLDINCVDNFMEKLYPQILNKMEDIITVASEDDLKQ